MHEEARTASTDKLIKRGSSIRNICRRVRAEASRGLASSKRRIGHFLIEAWQRRKEFLRNEEAVTWLEQRNASIRGWEEAM